MAVMTWCPSCGASMAQGASQCGTCGANSRTATMPATSAATRRFSWGGIGKAALVIFAVMAAFTWCSRLVSDDSYEQKASEIVNSMQKQVTNEIEANPDLDRCSAGSISSCDRLMTSIARAGDDIHSARNELSALTPSEQARSWHSDYLGMLGDYESVIRRMVSAWDANDMDAYSAALNELDSLDARESSLVDYFNGNLR